MSDQSKIEWTDTTWSPVVGCSKISEGCANCWAERFARRLKAMRLKKYQDVVDENGWTGKIAFDEKALDKPLHWRNPRRIFVVSMGDLFHPKVPFGIIADTYEVTAKCPQHTFLFLTKRVKRAAEFYRERVWNPRTPNIHLGVSISTQAEADEKIPILLQIPAAVRFVSCEPMLEEIDIRNILYQPALMEPPRDFATTGNINKIRPVLDWIVVGGESGPNARPMHPDWARSIRDQCKAAGVPFFFKQWGAWEIANTRNAARNGYVVTESRQGILTPYNRKKFINLNIDGSYYQDNPQPNSIAMACVGKKKAGCLLDRKEHKEYPNGLKT